MRKIPFNIDLSDNHIVNYLISVGILFGVLMILYLIAQFLARRLKRRYDHEAVSGAILKTRVPIILLICVLSLWIPLSFHQVPELISRPVRKILSISSIAIFAWMLIRLLALGKYVILKRYNMAEKDNLKARKIYTQFRIIERILVFIIVLISVSLILMTFSEIRKVGVSIIASAGVTGLIVGLAAQKMIGGVLAGIQVAITQPITMDDVVVVEGEWGRIEEINLTQVVVHIWDQRRLILPTTYFIEKPFQNWTKTSSEILGTVFIYTDYRVSVDGLRAELTRILKNSKEWDGRTNVLQVTDAKRDCMEIRALMSSADSSLSWDLRVSVREQLIAYLQREAPESLPRTRVSVLGDPDAPDTDKQP